MMDQDFELNDFWRVELGTEFRDKAIDMVGGYAETMGSIELKRDEKRYVATLDLYKAMETIVPLRLSCNMTTSETHFIAKIKVFGRLTTGLFGMEKRSKEFVKLYDPQDNEIDKSKICIDSLLYALDFLDTLNNRKVVNKN